MVYQISKARKVNQHWKNLGVPHVKPVLLFGNMIDLVFRRRTQQDIIKDIYEKFPNEKVIGYYHFMGPRLIIRDQELVERVLIRDFNTFHDRLQGFPSKGNPLLVNLFALSGQRWRAMRSKLSPMFTTGKLRHMFPQVSSIADALMPVLDGNKSKLDVKDDTSKFAMEVISSCAFGIEPAALDGESEFNVEAKLAFSVSFFIMVKRLVLFSLPKLAALLKLQFMPNRTVKYFNNVIKSAIVHRRETKTVRNDFVQQMVTLLDKGFIEIEKHDPGDDYLKIRDNEDNFKLELNEDVMVGQSFVFLLAGFETTSTAMSHMCLDLALNSNLQERAREEVNKIWKSDDLSYDQVKEMRFLEGCLKESLRLHPPVGHLTRSCGKTYTIPGTSLTIEPGQTVIVPSLAIHYNSEIYTEPEKFSPERWTSTSYPPCSFLPFGDGPRICIGMRFATMEAKCCLAKILRNYRISLHPSIELPIKMDPYSLFGSPLKPILLKLEKL